MPPSEPSASPPPTLTDLLTSVPDAVSPGSPLSWEDQVFGPGGAAGHSLPDYSRPTAGDSASVILDPAALTALGGDLDTAGTKLSAIHVPETLGIAGALTGSDIESACGTIQSVIESILAVYGRAVQSLGESVNSASATYVATDDANAFRFSGEMRW